MKGEPHHAGKKSHGLEKGAKETGHSMTDGVMKFHLGKRRTAGATSAKDADDRTMKPTTADTLVAHEERDKPWILDTTYYPEEKAGVAAESGPGPAMGDTTDTTASGPALETQERRNTSSSLSHLPPHNQEALSRMGSQKPDTTVNLNLDTDYPVHLHDDYDSDNDKKYSDDNEILEVPRGREGHLEMSTNGKPPANRRTMSGSSSVSNPVLGKGGMAEIPRKLSSTPPPTIPPSSILSPISSSPNIPLPHSQPGSRSRPRTAATAFTTTTTTSPSPLASAPASRPGTGDSIDPIRHHRLDSIRGITIPRGHVQGHRTPPTRDSSPSRSVRFVDYVDGESGHVGPSGHVGESSNGNDNEGRKVPIADIPSPMPSRSSSIYRDGNGRTLVGGVEGEEPAVTASGSVAQSTVASRPPSILRID